MTLYCPSCQQIRMVTPVSPYNIPEYKCTVCMDSFTMIESNVAKDFDRRLLDHHEIGRPIPGRYPSG